MFALSRMVSFTAFPDIYLFLIAYSSRRYFTTMYLVSGMDHSCLPGRLRRATEDVRSSRAARARGSGITTETERYLAVKCSSTESKFLHVLINDCLASKLPIQAG